MRKIAVFAILFCFALSGVVVAQQREDPDMTAYRARNGGIPGWRPQDGLGPAVNVHPTGATIGTVHYPIPGWRPQDGLGPAINVHPTGASINRVHYPIPGWTPQDGLGPVIYHNNINHSSNNSGSQWGNSNNWNNNNSNWGGNTGINPNSPYWHANWNNSSWGNAWNSWWGNSNPTVVVNNYYNPNSWWRDLRNAPPGPLMSWGNNNYYYHDGNFFNIVNGIYQVVMPVLGMILQTIPSGATQMNNFSNYYYYHGVFYYNTGNGYRVSEPPLGACLPSLPYFAKAVTIEGISCYQYDNVFLQPTYNDVDGDYCYQVVGHVY